MTEINPYEPPKTPPSKAGAAAKKGLGFVTLVVLTPIAAFIAGCCSCLAVSPTLDLVGSQTRELDEGSGIAIAFFAGWGVFLIPPLVVLILMGRWAIRSYNREVAEHNAKLKQTRLGGWKLQEDE